MKKLFVLMTGILLYASAVSQVDSITYGISALTGGPGLFLSRINASDGSVTKISLNAANEVPGGFGLTIDPLHHLFYYAPDSGLLAFDLKTGELLRKISITNCINTCLQGIIYNYRDSTLYGIAVNAAGFNIKLAKLDPVSGTVKAISATSLATSYNVLSGSALDPDHGIYYFQTRRNPANHLLAVDLYTGGILSDLPLGIDSTDSFGPMEYNCHDSSLYGLAGNYLHGRKLARVNPSDGTLSVLSRFNVADTILNEQVTIDPFQRIFYFEAIDHTYRGVDLVTGNLISMSGIIPFPGSYFTGFLFNDNCYFQSSSDIAENKTNPELTIFPNPASDQLNIRSSAPLLKVEILDFTGKSVLSENCHRLKEFQADIRDLQQGIYVVRINNEITVRSSRFVKALPGSMNGQ